MKIADKWIDYECLDIGNKSKIERFGPYYFKRPEPTATTKLTLNIPLDAEYKDGAWNINQVPQNWNIHYQDMTFALRPHEFKHLGIFPEQAVNWDFIRVCMRRSTKKLRILNLFGYTGGATIAAALENPEEVVHIDALKSAIARTQENIKLNKCDHVVVRTIVDDAFKFIQREIRRGRTYHGIILDPPSFGRGPKGEVWKINEMLEPLLNDCLKLLDKDAVFLILNTYSAHLPLKHVNDLLKYQLHNHNITQGKLKSHKLYLPVTKNKELLYCGKTTRWSIYEDLL